MIQVELIQITLIGKIVFTSSEDPHHDAINIKRKRCQGQSHPTQPVSLLWAHRWLRPPENRWAHQPPTWRRAVQPLSTGSTGPFLLHKYSLSSSSVPQALDCFSIVQIQPHNVEGPSKITMATTEDQKSNAGRHQEVGHKSLLQSDDLYQVKTLKDKIVFLKMKLICEV